MSDKIPARDITPESTYLNRRSFMRAGVLAATVAVTGYAYRRFVAPPSPAEGPPTLAGGPPPTTGASSRPAVARNAAFSTTEPLTPYADITHYNNFYEFTTTKEEVATVAEKFVTRPWTVAVGGLCAKPATFDLDDVLNSAAAEERVYRMRCVEGWSMVIPWVGFSLSSLLDRVEPTSAAKYVAFTTVFDPKQIPNQRSSRILDWPYVEGLRMDEAMHPLTMLASGIYGREFLPPQNGAPLRLVVPWKYGFKGIKSIVKIDLVADQPPTTWNLAGPSEYGFYSNVNPQVDHPRWSQATERRIGEYRKRDTLMFNGYGEQVAGLYSGMDLRTNY
jgi:sulfoxide reductase catalytic subunit YedY